MAAISPITRRRLGYRVSLVSRNERLRKPAHGLRLAFALCMVLAAAGTVLASPMFLWSLYPLRRSLPCFRCIRSTSYTTMPALPHRHRAVTQTRRSESLRLAVRWAPCGS